MLVASTVFLACFTSYRPSPRAPSPRMPSPRVPSPRAPSPRASTYEVVDVKFSSNKKHFRYNVKVQDASVVSGSPKCPPLLCIPPIGVGITAKFFEPLHREWAHLGAPCSLHTPDLLGCGSASPKTRTFYTPELYADALLAYIETHIKRPVVLVVQGGLLPVALEMWRKGGPSVIAGFCLMSPPPLRFLSPEAVEEAGVRGRFRGKAAAADSGSTRRRWRWKQRIFWALAQSSVGGFFFRYLRGADGARIRAFSERNLFADPARVDDEWMTMCNEGAVETRSRHATFAYLCGTVPGGAWRDDRLDLLKSLSVPCQVLRGTGAGDEAAVRVASERLEAFIAVLRRESCSGLVAGGRSVLPYENSGRVAQRLISFIGANFDAEVEKLSRRGDESME